MKQKTTKASTNEILKRLPLLLTLTALTIPTWLTACASINRKEETIHAILQKENALIEKLQAERAQPEIEQAISENERLKTAEAHLVLSLEELKEANKTIKTKFLKMSKEEDKHGQN